MPFKAQNERTVEQTGTRIRPILVRVAAVTSALSIFAAVIWATFILPTCLIEPRGEALSAKEQLDAEASLRGSIMQFIGGIIVLAGLYFTGRGFALSREGHMTDRYARAIELIGNESRDVRIGGLYALSRLAKDFDTDRQMIVEVLTAFVREHTQDAHRTPTRDKVRADVQVALSLLGKRPTPKQEARPLDFYHCGLNDADMSNGDFRKAWFYYCRLDGASFAGGRIDGAGLSFCEAKQAAFSSCSARGANFVNASYTDSWFLEADLTDCEFHGCDLSGSDFGRRYAEEGTPPIPPAILTNANFKKARLKGTILRGVDLSTVRGLTKRQLAEAITDKNTVMPRQWDDGRDDGGTKGPTRACS